MNKAAKTLKINPRIRVYRRDEIAMGPGKAELLHRVAQCGSLSQAAREMEMSYMKAWLLVRLMNRTFLKPLVSLKRGGRDGGRAAVTTFGLRVLELYREMKSSSLLAMKPAGAKLGRMLRP